MKNTSTEFNTIAENPFGAKYIHKIIDLTNNTEIKDDIDDFLYSAMINDDDVFTIGNTCSATISFSITNPTVNLNNKEIEVYQGLNVNGTVEYIKLGVFKVLKPKKDRSITKYQCVDRMTYLMNMPYSSNLTFPTTDVKILEEICTQVDITLVQNGLISHSISKSPSGYTKREIIAYMSQLQGKNAIINSDGNLELIWYTDTDYVVDDNKIYYDGTSDVNSEIDYEVEYLECTVRSLDGSEENVIKAGSGVNGIKIENPFMTQAILYEIANKLVGFTFRGAEFEFLGDFRLEVGDIVSVKTNNETYVVPIMQIEHKSDGGVVTTITSVGETDTENEIDLSSPNVHAMDRYYAELVLINKAMINKLSVDEADIKYLKVTQLEGIEANIENAVISNLEGKFVTVEELDAEKARITVLEANYLTANSVIIKELQAGVTKTNTLIFGSASGDTIQTSFSNSVIAQLGDAQIESAMIKEISALKITGLDLNTTKFTVHSEDGLSYWEDNTICIHDGVLDTPRIQIGKDGTGDYNMYIWNAQGKLMFDALGLTENGISRQIIRNDVVKDDANINATKLNIESLFNVINDETSYMLKSSKIWIDSEKQTLDVSFKVMSSNVSDLQETQISQGTNIETIQGQISSKIWQQDITTAIDDVNEDITSLTTKYSLLEQNVDSFKTTVSATYTTITEFNNLQIGGTNLFVTSTAESGYIGADGLVIINDKFYTSGYIAIESNQEYTLSRIEDTMTGSIVDAWRIACFDENKTFINRAAYTDLVKTLTFDDTVKYIRVSAGKLSKIKVEKGNRATDWSPSPEDIDTELESTKSIATQTSEMMDWLVESGTSATNFTLTDRMAELTAQKIKLNGYLEVDGDMLVDGAITAEKLSTDAIKSRNFAIDNATGNITQGMFINLQDGTLNSRYVSWDNKGKLKATSVDLSGNFNALTGTIGNWVLDEDGYLYSKTLVGTTTAGTVYKTYLKASSGSYDSVVIGASIAPANNENNEEWMFRINADGTFITRSQLSVYSADGITTTGPITTTKKMSCNDGCYINGKTELHGNGLELYYTTPYIDFHYNNNSDDHTARIVENSSGALTVYNSISNASDRRLKQDVCSLDKRYINALNLFKPTSYRFIKGSDNLNLGFMAQDVKKALLDSGITDLPIVSQDNDGIYSLDYNQITALNTLGHLDHEKRIQQLENDLAVANALIQSLLLQQSSV